MNSSDLPEVNEISLTLNSGSSESIKLDGKSGSGKASRGKGFASFVKDKLGSAAAAGVDEIAQQNERSKAIYKTIGAYDKFGAVAGRVTKQLIDYQSKNIELGISAKETDAAFANYYGNLTAVAIPNQEKSMVSIMDQQIQMGRLGAEVGDTTDIFNTWTSAFGMNAEQMNKSRGVLVKYAKESGLGKKVFKEYAGAMESFMDVLDPNVMHRQGLAFAAMATRMGTSAGTLINAMKGFDVMDDAQEMGGKLNAVLGPMGLEFDAVKASMMDLPERTKYISETMQKAGKYIGQFDTGTQRKWMMALQSTGVTGADPKIMRGMMSGRADQTLTAERAMLAGTGAPTGFTDRQMRDAAIGGTTISEKYKSGVEASISLFVARIASPENVARLSTAIGTAAQDVIFSKADKAVAKAIKGITDHFKVGTIAEAFTLITKTIVKLEEVSETSNALAAKAASQAELLLE